MLRKKPKELKKMTDAAYEKATTVFSWSRIAELTEAVYESVLSEYAKSGWS